MLIVKTLTTFAAVLGMLMVMACAQATKGVSATEAAMCDVWQDSLPSRSQDDTAQSKAEIGRAYDVFEAVCVGWSVP